MNRHAGATSLLLFVLLLVPMMSVSPAFGQAPPAAPVQVPSAPAQAPVPAAGDQGRLLIERESAQETRQRLQELLRQHPPAVGEVLRRDPTLARPDYLAPYPALVGFLQQHPEIARNPSFFFGEYEYQPQEPRDRSYEMFRQVTDLFQFVLIAGGVMFVFVWLVRSTIDQRRWLRVSKTQAEVHTKMLDRLSTNEELLAYIQSPAGRRFLEAAPLLVDGDSPRPASAPLSRIIWSLQAGVVLACLGIGFWVSQTRFPADMAEGFFVIGTLATALGVGFAVSAVLAYMISSRFGLVTPPAAVRHD